MNGSKTDVEKSLYSFFLLNAFQGIRTPVIKSYIEKLLDDQSHELNLIGSYLFKNKPSVTITEFDADFSSYIWEKPKKQKKNLVKKQEALAENDFFLVRSENLIPVLSPSTIFGVNRIQKNTIELKLPKIVEWEKVTLKIKDGLQEVEIFYDNKYIKTTGYIELGWLHSKKEQRHDRQWGFLCALSALSATDIKQATADKMRDMVAVNSQVTLKIANVHQIKRILVKRLRALFKTSENPFNDRKDYYLPRFTILPEPDLRQSEIWSPRLRENRSHEPDFFVDNDKENQYEDEEEAL